MASSSAAALLEPLSAARIRDAAAGAPLESLEVLPDVDSTNAYLLRRAAPPVGRVHVCIAERQSAGRGRRGREWVAPPGAVCLSLGWHFERRASALSALSLAVGVGVVHALQTCGVTGVQLKWPNDLVWQSGKLGGILVELRTDTNGRTYGVVGIGINVLLSEEARGRIAPGWSHGPVSLLEILGTAPERSVLAGRLVATTATVLARFTAEGFAPFRPRYAELDCLQGLEVRVVDAGGEWRARAQGIDEQGALVVQTHAGEHAVQAGDVSVAVRP